MSSETFTLSVAGLHTFNQTLMEIPPGSLLKANNIIIDRAGVIEKRRGFKQYSQTSYDSAPKQLLEYKSTILSHIENKILYDKGNGVFEYLRGEYLEPHTGYKINYAEAKGNLYFTTSEGVKKISIKSAEDFALDTDENPLIDQAGGPKAMSGISQLTTADGFYIPSVLEGKNLLKAGESVNYRILWIYSDRNDNLIFGSPSPIIFVKNDTTSEQNVNLIFPIPFDAESGYKYRIYRSETSPSNAPSDELYQIYEGTYNGTPSPGFNLNVIDNYPEDLLTGGVPLYTNQNSGEGILKSNEPPPSARDITLFKGHMFYANTRTKHSTILQLVDNQALTGKKLIINDSIFISIEPGANIEETAKNIVSYINVSGSPVSAIYISNKGSVPGRIYLESKNLKDISFSITSDAPSNFSPNLQTALTSKTEKVGNRLYWSKYQEHEAVPLLNYVDVGVGDQEIERIIALRESVFILKQDGIYRLSGNPGPNPAWDVSLFDTTTLEAPDTAVVLLNQCYFFGHQGISRLNETSVDPISLPIKNKLVPFITKNKDLSKLSFCVPYETENSLLCFTCLSPNDKNATVCYRYNVQTQTWTEWKMTKTCGVVSRSLDKLYLGSGVIDEYYIEEERKNFSRFDYCDYELDSSFVSGSLTENVLYPENFEKIQKGDVIAQVQYVTIYQFNSLLKKLDLDYGLNVYVSTMGPNNFYIDLKISYSDNLTQKMTELVFKLNKLEPDQYFFSGTVDPVQIQNEFNVIIDTLNRHDGLSKFKNYEESTGSIIYESIVEEVDSVAKFVTLNSTPSFILGDLKIYKNIPVEIEYAPQHGGNPASFKQFSNVTFLFERRSFYNATVSYNSDISENYENLDIIPRNSGIFGNSPWGDGILWGGVGDQSNLRTLVPLNKQRCRFLGCKFVQNIALESFQLYGISLTARTYMISNRDYK